MIVLPVFTETHIWNKASDTHSSFSSLHWGCFSRSESCFIPESVMLFSLRSSSLRDGFDLRAELRSVKPSSLIRQDLNLWNKVQDTGKFRRQAEDQNQHTGNQDNAQHCSDMNPLGLAIAKSILKRVRKW